MTLYVDGNQYQSITHAQENAELGDTIVVAGMYNDKNIGKTGLHYEFSAGSAVINGATGASIFIDSIMGEDPANYSVKGGRFIAMGQGSEIFHITNKHSLIKADIESFESSGRGIAISAGTLIGSAKKAKTKDGTFDLLANNNDAFLFFECETAISKGLVLEMDGGEIHYKGNRIESTGNAPIEDISGKIFVEGCHIVAPSGEPISISSGKGIYFRGCSFESDIVNKFQTSQSGKHFFADCYKQ